MYKTELSGKKPSCLKSLFAFHEALSSFKSPKRSTDGGGEAGGGGVKCAHRGAMFVSLMSAVTSYRREIRTFAKFS